jgi:uncharacterized protein YbaP (TraB family)
MLWKVEEGGLALLGSVHLLDVADLPLSDAAWDTFNAAERVVFEHDFIQPPDMSFALSLPGQSLRTVVPPPLFEALRECCQQLSFNIANIIECQPWYAGMSLSRVTATCAGLLVSNGVDTKLWEEARRRGKAIEYLEDLGVALRPLSDAPLDEQLTALRLAVMDPGGTFQFRLIDGWKRRRADLILGQIQERLSLAPVMSSILLENRNRNWLPRLSALANEQTPTLAVVGALHLVGGTGLPALLRAEGYNVTPVDVSGE